MNEVVGRITATLAAGQGYTIAASPGDSASVTVTDNDTPVLSIAHGYGHGGFEGTSATFTVTASPVPCHRVNRERGGDPDRRRYRRQRASDADSGHRRQWHPDGSHRR